MQAQQTEKVDPNHVSTGGYGYLLHQDKTAGVWWCEGAYKVMRDVSLPSKTSANIDIRSAKNEFESFIISIRPSVRIDKVRIEPGVLIHSDGKTSISNSQFQIKRVEYVKVNKPTDNYGFTGWWPDP
ncbi:MAG: hypothetical protein RIR48_2161, partial [Bacteroidota bacterium]